MMSFKLFFILVAFILPVFSEDLFCRDDQGNTVEWFVAYKIPRNGNDRGGYNSGSNYTYILGKQIKENPKNKPAAGQTKPQENWRISPWMIESKRSMVGRTLAPIYAFPGDYTHFMYNDEPAVGDSDDKTGFSKGVLAMDTDNGFWMTHSVPKFPPPHQKCYEYREAGEGDMFFCLSFKTNEAAKDIVQQLNRIKPLVYDTFIQQAVVDKVGDDLYLLTSHSRKHKHGYPDMHGGSGNGYTLQPYSQKVDVKGAAGEKTFSVISRQTYSQGNGDFYHGILDRNLKKNLYVKTRDYPIKSVCNGEHAVMNVKKAGIGFSREEGSPGMMGHWGSWGSSASLLSGPWDSNNDRSRYAISIPLGQKDEKPVVCVTDLDRKDDHARRGGLAICLEEQKVHNVFLPSVNEFDHCGRSLFKH